MRRAALPVLGLALVVSVIIAAGSGQVRIPPLEVVGSVLHRAGLDWGPRPHVPHGDATLWDVRFPRIVLSVLVGGSLAVAGAAMQGIFGNPLAEPATIGVSTGAAVGAFAVIVSGASLLGGWTITISAFVGGLLATVLVYALSRSGGRTEVVTLVLTGVALNALTGALIGLLVFAADDDARTQIAFWQLGSMGRATWSSCGVVAPLALVGTAVCCAHARRLDLLALGEGPARHLGVDVEQVRRRLMVAGAVLTAAAVSFTGVIAFLGLVVPHLVRLALGPGHRLLLPASMLGGATLLVLADLVARTAIANQELPLSVLTALVGGPFFFWLLRRSRAQSGGWA